MKPSGRVFDRVRLDVARLKQLLKVTEETDAKLFVLRHMYAPEHLPELLLRCYLRLVNQGGSRKDELSAWRENVIRDILSARHGNGVEDDLDGNSGDIPDCTDDCPTVKGTVNCMSRTKGFHEVDIMR